MDDFFIFAYNAHKISDRQICAEQISIPKTLNNAVLKKVLIKLITTVLRYVLSCPINVKKSSLTLIGEEKLT